MTIVHFTLSITLVLMKIPFVRTALGVLLISFSFIGFISCIQKQVTHHIPYQIDKPNRLLNLSNDLIEISGLTNWGKGELAAIQDEKGKIYILDPVDGSVKREIKFGPKGDYEDIAKVGKTLWIVRSDGVLFRVKDVDGESPKIKSYETKLSAENDVEGLYFDEEKNGLWMACKESPHLKGKDHLKGKRAVYFFDFEDKKLKKDPLFTVDSKAIKQFQNLKYGDQFSQPFKPSAIARRPKDGFVYIVSSVGQTLLVLNTDYEIHDVIRLKSEFGPQPESLIFDDNNGLYIASEGKEQAATLLYFAAQD